MAVAIIVGLSIVFLVIGLWVMLCFKRKTVFVCNCCYRNPAMYMEKTTAEDGTEQPRFTATGMLFASNFPMGYEDEIEKSRKKAEEKKTAHQASTSTEGAETPNFCKEPNDVDMIKRY